MKPEEKEKNLEKVNYDEIVREAASIEDLEKVKEKRQIVAAVEDIYTVEQQLQSLAIDRAVFE